MHLGKITLLFALLASYSAFAESSLLHEAIIGGERVTSDSRVYKMTVHLVADVTIDGSPGTASCTGTIIARDLIMTAAHCVTSDDGSIQFKSIVAITGSGQRIPVLKSKANPAYAKYNDAGLTRPIHDIALIRLSAPVAAPSLVAPVPASEMAIGSSEDMVVAGFGYIDANDSGSGGTLFFAWTEGRMMSVGFNVDHQIEMTGVQPCHGDSGGPIFRADPKHIVVLGVTSHVKGNCEVEGRAISVASHLGWLRKTAAELGSSSKF